MQCLCFLVGSVNRNIKVKGSNDLEYSNSIFHCPTVCFTQSIFIWQIIKEIGQNKAMI